MLRLLVTVCIVGACSLAIPAIIQSDPDGFERGLAAGVENAKKIVATYESKPKRRQNLSGRRVRLPMNAQGHFVSDFRLNGRKVNALVDTGATLIAINERTARKIGLKLKPSDFKYEVRTANGIAKAASKMIGSVEIGRIRITNVQAAIMQDRSLQGTLIGMSFLKRLKSFKVENQALLLQQ